MSKLAGAVAVGITRRAVREALVRNSRHELEVGLETAGMRGVPDDSGILRYANEVD